MIIAIIPAKKGSKRMKDKNIRKILDKTLLEYAIEYAKDSKMISKIYVSTDDDMIADISKINKVEVIMRPESLGDETPLLDVYKHALSKIPHEDVEIVAGVQADHPDRDISLDEALQVFMDRKLDKLFSIEKSEQKNGAHYILNKTGIINNHFEKEDYIIDDCTNIHFDEDLLLAEKRIIAKKEKLK